MIAYITVGLPGLGGRKIGFEYGMSFEKISEKIREMSDGNTEYYVIIVIDFEMTTIGIENALDVLRLFMESHWHVFLDDKEILLAVKVDGDKSAIWYRDGEEEQVSEEAAKAVLSAVDIAIKRMRHPCWLISYGRKQRVHT